MRERLAQPGAFVRNLDTEQTGVIQRVYADWQGVLTALVVWDDTPGVWAASVKRLAKHGRKERVSA